MAKKNNYAALEQLHAAAMIAKENKNAMDMIHPEAEKDLALHAHRHHLDLPPCPHTDGAKRKGNKRK